MKRTSRRPQQTAISDNFSMQSDEQIHPAEDAILNFKPEVNKIDKVLYDAIVDEMPTTKATWFPRNSNHREGFNPEEAEKLIETEEDMIDSDSSSD